MLSIPESVRIFVAREPADFRKQFDGLAAIARDDLGLDPFGGHVFVFFNRRRDRIKLLVFQHTGFWLHYKRLERGTFDVALGEVDDDSQSIEFDCASAPLAARWNRYAKIEIPTSLRASIAYWRARA